MYTQIFSNLFVPAFQVGQLIMYYIPQKILPFGCEVESVEQNKCILSSIWRMNFQRPPLLHPLQKHFEGADDVDGVPLGTF